MDADSFMALVLAKQARLSDFGTWVQRWHDGAAPDKPLTAFLGLTSQQLEEVTAEPYRLAEIAFDNALALHKPQLMRHIKSDGEYLVLACGRLEHNLQDVTVYLGLDGQVWVRDRAEFEDGRFETLKAQGTAKQASLEVNLRRAKS